MTFLNVIGSLSTCNRAETAGIVAELGEGNQGLDRLEISNRIDPLDPAPPAGDVALDITGIFTRKGHLEENDRLQQNWLG